MKIFCSKKAHVASFLRYPGGIQLQLSDTALCSSIRHRFKKSKPHSKNALNWTDSFINLTVTCTSKKTKYSIRWLSPKPSFPNYPNRSLGVILVIQLKWKKPTKPHKEEELKKSKSKKSNSLSWPALDRVSHGRVKWLGVHRHWHGTFRREGEQA